MTPELLALLTPEQQEAWERCEKATPGPWVSSVGSWNKSSWKHKAPLTLLGGTLANFLVMNTGDASPDGDFAAHACQDLPAALLELAQAQQALAEAKLRLLDAQAARTIWMERSKANAAEYNAAYDAMCEIGEMLGCAEDWAAIKAALKETLGKVGELRAAVADAPHDMWCAVTFPAIAPAKLMVCNCWKSETK